jgi:hypothetical protein
MHTPVVPIKRVRKPCTADQPGTESDQWSDHARLLPDDHCLWLVSGDIDDLRVCRLDLDNLLVLDHPVHNPLLGRGLQVTGGIRFTPELLDGVEDVGLLRGEGFSQCAGPVHILIHELQNRGIVEQRDETRIPVCTYRRHSRRRRTRHMARRLGDIERECRSHQHLREQRIRVQGDRRDQGLELIQRECRSPLLGRVHGIRRLCPPGNSTAQGKSNTSQ